MERRSPDLSAISRLSNVDFPVSSVRKKPRFRSVNMKPETTFSITPHPQLPGYLLVAEQWVPRPIDQIFAFFDRPENLQGLTPPQLRFEILTPQPIEMKQGTEIDYRIKVHGLPLRWKSLITEYEPGVQFVDEQLKGPYKVWHHTHRFDPLDEGTLIQDRVHFRVPGGALAFKLFVKPDLHRIFAYRAEKTVELFGE